jgi:hypothetical protein
MNIVRFNRHQLFNEEWMNYHSQTLREVENFYIDQNESWFNDLYNQLCGVWDGYLYTEMLESAKQYGLPTNLLQRIANTMRFIQTNQK